ncbi:MAG TPA: hypothetical protein EYG38_04730, partial [Verrucomicrobia bacterium]|nr:hypothetical protein [Verrucomicrobiota bacterium]
MSSLALDYQRTEHRQPTKILTGMDSGVNGFVGTWTRFHARSDSLKKEAEAIVALESEWQSLSDRNLHDRLRDLGMQMRRHSYLEKPELYQALAGIREAAFRQVALKAFPVQLMGALALHRGSLAEMATGEGKTLTAGLAAVLAGWSGKPCHILTVNDYLVSRDMEWLRPLYRFCGVTVGNITSGMSPQDRQVQYERDVVYSTAKEVLADFLRDKLRVSELWQPTRRLIRRLLKSQSGRASGIVMRGLYTVIVDEADSILIDEAVTPLIISAQKENPILHKAVTTAFRIVKNFKLGVHYTKSIKYKEIDFTDEGLTELERACKDLPGFWRGRDRRQELIRQALVAREFFHR